MTQCRWSSLYLNALINSTFIRRSAKGVCFGIGTRRRLLFSRSAAEPIRQLAVPRCNFPTVTASQLSSIRVPRRPRSGLGFGSVSRRVPFNGSPAPALPHRPATRPHATALTPPQPSWMRSSAPLSAHCTMRSRCAAVTSHGAVTYKRSSARRTGSQLQATAVSGATPPCPATCLTSRARTQLPDKSACGSLALPHAATANPRTPCPTRTSRRQHGTHSARRRIPPGRPSRLYPVRTFTARSGRALSVQVFNGRRSPSSSCARLPRAS